MQEGIFISDRVSNNLLLVDVQLTPEKQTASIMMKSNLCCIKLWLKRRRTHCSLKKEYMLYDVYLFTTPIMPSLMGMTLPIRTSMASVPASIRSSLVTTARVLLPGARKCAKTDLVSLDHQQETQVGETSSGHQPSASTSRATFRASEVAMSVLAAVTARMMEFGLEMYL